MWSGERLTEVQTTTRPDHVWPEVWTNFGKDAQNREKLEWKNEKPKLDNARRLTGIYFIDLDDQDYKETLKNARIKLERPTAAATPCKRKARTSTTKVAAKQVIASKKVRKTKHACIVEEHESTRQRLETSLPNDDEDHIAGKGFTSMTHYNLGHKFVPLPQAMQTPDAEAAVDKAWKKLETIPSMATGESQEHEEGYSRSTERKKESPLCYTDGHMSPEKRGVRTKNCKNTKAESCSVVTL